MSYIISLQSEILKTKRSAAFWVCFLSSGFIPALCTLIYSLRPDKFLPRFKMQPWEAHFLLGWLAFTAFLLPMFVILVCSMITQIEYKNNTWKQVFASPQSLGNIFFSKFSTILLMVLFLFIMFNFFMVVCAVLVSIINNDYPFLRSSAQWSLILKLNLKTFVALLGIISIQYWLSLRIKNFIVPIAIGLALLMTATIVQQWEHIDKVPYAFPFLTFLSISKGGLRGNLFQNHELNSMGYLAFFNLLAFLDMKYRKERG
jgi:lantibiotic transport system permease protein